MAIPGLKGQKEHSGFTVKWLQNKKGPPEKPGEPDSFGNEACLRGLCEPASLCARSESYDGQSNQQH